MKFDGIQLTSSCGTLSRSSSSSDLACSSENVDAVDHPWHGERAGFQHALSVLIEDDDSLSRTQRQPFRSRASPSHRQFGGLALNDAKTSALKRPTSFLTRTGLLEACHTSDTQMQAFRRKNRRFRWPTQLRLHRQNFRERTILVRGAGQY